MIEELERKRAILYARVSTDDHDQRVETQEREMRRYCEENNIEAVAYYCDEKTFPPADHPLYGHLLH